MSNFSHTWLKYNESVIEDKVACGCGNQKRKHQQPRAILLSPSHSSEKYESLTDLWHWLFITVMCCSYQMSGQTSAGSRLPPPPPYLLFFHNMSPKPIIVCLEANFPVTDQPMFPCIEQHCVSWLLCFPDDCVFFQHGRWTECFALWSVFER